LTASTFELMVGAMTTEATTHLPARHTTERALLRDVPAIEALTQQVERVERGLHDLAAGDSPLLQDVAMHLIRAGGKRLRPLLTLLSAWSVSGDRNVSDPVVTAAAAVELLHLGTLYHDDVMDSSSTRRSVDSVNARWGNSVAVQVGDLLLIRGGRACIRLGHAEAGVMAEALDHLAVGQALELFSTFDETRDEARCREAMDGKTAALIALGCELGAMEAGAGPEDVRRCARFGHHVGMAFQMIDDIQDLCLSDEELGKPAGSDLRRGVYTLPIIFGAQDDPTLRRWIGRRLEDDEADEAIRAFRASSGLPRAIAVARDELGQAVDTLAQVSAVDDDAMRCARDVLDAIEAPLEQVVDRENQENRENNRDNQEDRTQVTARS